MTNPVIQRVKNFQILRQIFQIIFRRDGFETRRYKYIGVKIFEEFYQNIKIAVGTNHAASLTKNKTWINYNIKL